MNSKTFSEKFKMQYRPIPTRHEHPTNAQFKSYLAKIKEQVKGEG